MNAIKECRHIMPSGLHCKSPAMRGTAFCYFHGRAPRPSRPALTHEANLDIPHIGSPNEILPALNEVLQALAANRISPRRAGILLQAVQLASSLGSSGPADLALPSESLHSNNTEPNLNHPKQ